MRSSQSYDHGFVSEAKRLAVVLRVLLHDTKNQTSLLTLLNKKNIMFYDTSTDYDPNNLLPTMGLIMMRIGPEGAEYVAPLDEGSPTRRKGKVPFDKWWNKIIFASKGDLLTRKDLILSVANKDGGAHVDPKLDEVYAKLTRFNLLGWKYTKDGKEKSFIVGPEFASIRQISHEVLKSLKDEFPEYF
jgi:hypothetical protein